MKKILFFLAFSAGLGLTAKASSSTSDNSGTTVNLTTNQNQGELTNKKSSAKYNFTLLSFFKEEKKTKTDTVNTDTRVNSRSKLLQD